MSGSSVTLSGFAELEARLDPQRLMDQIQDIAEESLADGKRDMEASIKSRGTGKTWQKPWGGRAGSFPGRVDSGDMLDAVEGRVTRRTTTRVEGILGWPDGSPDYFRFQEAGFRHIMAGADVAGMMALRDASDSMRADLLERLERIEI